MFRERDRYKKGQRPLGGSKIKQIIEKLRHIYIEIGAIKYGIAFCGCLIDNLTRIGIKLSFYLLSVVAFSAMS